MHGRDGVGDAVEEIVIEAVGAMVEEVVRRHRRHPQNPVDHLPLPTQA